MSFTVVFVLKPAADCALSACRKSCRSVSRACVRRLDFQHTCNPPARGEIRCGRFLASAQLLPVESRPRGSGGDPAPRCAHHGTWCRPECGSGRPRRPAGYLGFCKGDLNVAGPYHHKYLIGRGKAHSPRTLSSPPGLPPRRLPISAVWYQASPSAPG